MPRGMLHGLGSGSARAPMHSRLPESPRLTDAELVTLTFIFLNTETYTYIINLMYIYWYIYGPVQQPVVVRI